MVHFFLKFLICLGCLCGISTTSFAIEEKPFVVVIPSYNNSRWYEHNLGSVYAQKYENYRVVFIDDASPDGTGELVRRYVQQCGQEHRTTIVQNTERRGALANVYQGIWLCKPYEIVANLDGDDWMFDEHVLERLNREYADPDVWVTYGQFLYYPCGSAGWAAQVPEEVIATNSFRDNQWTTTAMRTFYAGLFHKIKKEDLLYNGDFYPMAGDLAYMWPILEMAGFHSRFIPDILYVYNLDTPLNDMKKDAALQQRLGLLTRITPRYSPLEKPYD